MTIDNIISRFDLRPNTYLAESPYKQEYKEKIKDILPHQIWQKADEVLLKKWLPKIEKNWYGFDLGYPVPYVWYNAIDKFLESVQERCPEFKILQIKLKMGGLRCYLKNITEEIQEECYKLESVLFDEYLIY